MKVSMQWCKLVDVFNFDFFYVSFFIRVIEMNIDEKTGIKWTSSMHPSRRLEYPLCASFLEKGLFSQKSNEVVLDAGGGGSAFPFLVSKKVREVHITDIDMNYIDMVKKIQEACPEYSNIIPAKEDILSMSYPDKSFDKTFCISVLEHHTCNTKVGEAIMELLRVTKKKLVVTMDVGSKVGKNGPLTFKTLYDLSDAFEFEVPDRSIDCFMQVVDGYSLSIACICFDLEA